MLRSRRIALALVALLVLAASSSVDAGRFKFKGEVSRVIDGDTIQVALDTGTSTRVRLIGIDTPESGACYAAKASARTRQLALGKRVTLIGDPTQATRDRYRRLLAYAWISGKDVGYQLLAGGYAKVYVFDRPFRRLSAYRSGLWRACQARRTPPPSPPPPSRGNCDPSYPGVCIPPYPPDLDCADVPYTNFRVLSPDPHGFDGNDNDGVGCEE
jgi:endonuclease YncB( thermonuclease family)